MFVLLLCLDLQFVEHNFCCAFIDSVTTIAVSNKLMNSGILNVPSHFVHNK